MKIETSRGRLAFERVGEGGPTVLLMHPLALRGAFWDPLAQYLRERATVLSLDARGHGDSDWDTTAFTVEDMADDAAALIEALGVGAVATLGMSMGGCTALSLAQRRADLVNRLVLADTTACYGPDRVEKWEERAVNAVQKPRSAQVEFQRDRWFTERFRTERPDEVERVVDLFLKTSSEHHAAASRAMGAFDGTPLLGQVKAPTLVLVGDEDYATPPSMAQTLADGISGARLEVLTGARHLSLLERPDVWPSIARHLLSDAA